MRESCLAKMLVFASLVLLVAACATSDDQVIRAGDYVGGAGLGDGVASDAPGIPGLDGVTGPRTDLGDGSSQPGQPDGAPPLTDTPSQPTDSGAGGQDTAEPPVDTGPCTSFGCPCQTNADCDSALCVDGREGRICTEGCVDTCPEPGFQCILTTAFGPDPVSACVPLHAFLCRPCNGNSDCGPDHEANVSLCLEAAEADEGSFCGSSCAGGVPCPDGFICGLITLDGGGEAQQCQPADGACSCLPGWADLDLETSCTIRNSHGACPGTRTCGPHGLTSCSGRLPGPETCNDVDDDCNGETDDIPATACENENEHGACSGVLACSAEGEEICEARTPALEVCNGSDDDCDGETDESCDDGNACTHSDACSAGACEGVAYDCNDGLTCTSDACDGEGGCLDDLAAGFCLVDGRCVPDGQVESEGGCRFCDAQTKPRAWSVNDGAECDDGQECTHSDRCNQSTCLGTPYDCDDSDPCTIDSCLGNGQCEHEQADTHCTIGGQCYAEGAPHPNDPCRVCNPAQSTGTWSGATGATCDDGNACTASDSCKGGVCTGTPYSCNDSLPCTDDVCDGSGGCNNPLKAGRCLISLQCYDQGDPKPGNTCERCSSANPRAWTAADGSGCDDGEPCTENDSCNGTACEGTPKRDNYEGSGGNDTVNTAHNLGSISDGEGPNYKTFTATLYGPGDEDWYKVSYKDDTNTDAGPIPIAKLSDIPASSNYDLCIWWEEKDGERKEVDCDKGAKKKHSSGLWGCCSARFGSENEEAELDPGNLTLRDDGGTAWFQVKRVSGAWNCSPYKLQWGDD